MKIEKFPLWGDTQVTEDFTPEITAYLPENRKSSWGIVIFPGGAYAGRAGHEGEGYAEYLAENGVCAFAVDYRVAPHRFPAQLADARRAVQWVRSRAAEYGIQKDKIAVMGSSAGGHLAALVSNYAGEIATPAACAINEDYRPNAQILCYPVISLEPPFGHTYSGECLLGPEQMNLLPQVSPLNLVTADTPPAFIWHTFADNAVSVLNTLEYAKALKASGVKAEIHIFPDGCHGLGPCTKTEALQEKPHWSEDVHRLLSGEDGRVKEHNRTWMPLLLDWLRYCE